MPRRTTSWTACSARASAASTSIAQSATDHVAGAASAVSAAAEQMEASMREVAATGAFTEQERYRREGETVDATTESTEEHA